MFVKLLCLFLLVLILIPAYGGEAKPVAEDVALENRVMDVSSELRCLVCQNQTIADSRADLALDLRNQVREMLRQGKSKDEIVDYMVRRYGDFVLYRPLVKSSTWVLWFGPFILLVLALVVLIFKLRQRHLAMQQEASLSSTEHEQVASLLSETDKGI
ncbi:MAG: cytochrome c-type biogenesis protein [Gallionellaceae bacterium]